jgi:hypothetical protein
MRSVILLMTEPGLFKKARWLEDASPLEVESSNGAANLFGDANAQPFNYPLFLSSICKVPSPSLPIPISTIDGIKPQKSTAHGSYLCRKISYQL